MITKKMIARGIEKGIVKFIVDPNMDHGTVCMIGNGGLCNWFYFGGTTAEEMDPEEYQKNVPLEDIIDEVYVAVTDMIGDEEFQLEYDIYKAVLSVLETEYDSICYNGVNYPTRDINVTDFGIRTISVESLENTLMNDTDYVSDEARAIDEGIFYYVPDEIIELGEDKVQSYLKRHLS